MNEDGLLAFRSWILGHKCQRVAVESTGNYWYPIFSILEGHVEFILANAFQVRNIEGKKTDRLDSERIAKSRYFEKYKDATHSRPEGKNWQDDVRLLCSAMLFSATIYFSGTRLFIDAPMLPEMRWSKSTTKSVFTAERVLGEFYSIQFILAIEATVIRWRRNSAILPAWARCVDDCEKIYS